MNRRIAVAVAMGLLVVAFYIVLLYAFVAWLWPILPDWALLIGFLIIAVAVISSPMVALKYYGRARSAAERTTAPGRHGARPERPNAPDDHDTP